VSWIIFLILFPLLPASLLLIVRHERLQKWIVSVASVFVVAASVGLAISCTQGGVQYFSLSSTLANRLVISADMLLALVFLYVCRRLPLQRYWIPLLVILQYGLVFSYELGGKVPEVTNFLFIDNLSIIMALVIGIVGSLIAIYTIGYMKHYHDEHPDVPDRRGQFLATIFLFFFAMYGIIFSNSIAWIYFFWEVTTLCSFIMIGYSRTEEAKHNAFLALWMLLLGGLAFAAAIVYSAVYCGTVELGQLVSMNKAVVMLPVLLICFAGMNKAAQFPFAPWLLGAMVAPTPSSALLHSSTMVKAGVYITIRCAPVLSNSAGGFVVALLGGLSFLAGSALAISQSDGKRVLAYSTIANLGLIVLCAGVGSHLSLWAATLLIIFHAPAKALMFICVGTVEQQTGSRDIEDMRGLISRMPLMTICMLIGVAGMFLAPFGMLICKWAVMESLARMNPILPVIVTFGGSLMLFFWAKWMGQLITVVGTQPEVEKGIGIEWTAISGLAGLTIAACALYPLAGSYLIEPLFGADPLLSRRAIVMVSVMLGLILLLPLGFLVHWKNLVHTEPYLAGVNVSDPHKYMGSLGKPRTWWFSNYYIDTYFGERRLFPSTVVVSLVLLAAMFFGAAW
jgi:ech hydrogenase subunit A